MDQKAKEALERIEHLYLVKNMRESRQENKEKIFQEILELARENDFQQWVHFAQGVLYCFDEKYEPASEEYDAAFAFDSQFAYAWNGKGNVLRVLKKYDEALAAYEKAIELDPKYVYPWNGKGNLLVDLKKSDDALAAFEKAIELDPKYVHSWNGKGNVLVDLKKSDDALAAYEKAIELDPKYVYPWNGKGNVLYDLGRKEEALAAYEKAIELDPKLAYPWNGKGNALKDLGRKEEALAAYEKGIELNPEEAYPWNGKGNVLRVLKKYDEALAAYEKAIELDPELHVPYYNRGLLFQETGKWLEAKADFEIFISLNDDDYWEKMAVLRLKQIKEKLAEQEVAKKKSSKKKPGKIAARPIPKKKAPLDVGVEFAEQYKCSGLADEVEKRRKKLDEEMGKALNPTPQLNSERINNSLHVLRDWNSYTPILPVKFRPDDDNGPAERRGGGYFLVWRGFGVVIDPGLHFINQLYNKKLSIADVNAVVVTHCHLDHTRDIEALIDLNYRLNKKRNHQPKEDDFNQIHFYLCSSAKHKYQEYLKCSGCCEDPKILTGSKKQKITDYLDVTAIEVFHDDIVSKDEAVGCIFEMKDDVGKIIHRFGFTSDTRQDDSLAEKFKDCDVLLAHLGTTETIEEVGKKGLKNHLGVMGCCDLMMKVKPKLFIVGEFGEELIKARLNILEYIKKYKPEKTVKILAADSKLSIKFSDELEVFCSHPGCESTTIPIKEVTPLLGEDSLFRYYCQKHFA